MKVPVPGSAAATPEDGARMADGECHLSSRDFARLQQFAQAQIGLHLHDGKRMLANARVAKEMRRLGLTTVREYFQMLEADASGELIVGLVDSLTTNFTSFFREPEHFRFFEDRILATAQDHRECRIWCAASSTGEEPYTILSCWHSSAGSAYRSLRLVASDISTRVLGIAQRGVYSADRFSGEALARMRPMLLKGRRSAEGYYCIRPEYRKQVEFRRINLMHPFPFGNEFHCIFCRNAMIYFNRSTQRDVVSRLCRCLLPGGYLFVGHSESLGDLRDDLEYVRPAIYRRRGGA